MKTKTLLAGLVGGVTYFAMGFIIFGLVLGEDFMKNNFSCTRASEDMVWWAMIASQILSGLLLAMVFDWSNTSGFMKGLVRATIFGIVYWLAVDLGFYSMYDIYINGLTTVAIDVFTGVAMIAVTGGVVGWMLGRGNTAAA